jgi:hypothetical protein
MYLMQVLGCRAVAYLANVSDPQVFSSWSQGL